MSVRPGQRTVPTMDVFKKQLGGGGGPRKVAAHSAVAHLDGHYLITQRSLYHSLSFKKI